MSFKFITHLTETTFKMFFQLNHLKAQSVGLQFFIKQNNKPKGEKTQIYVAWVFFLPFHLNNYHITPCRFFLGPFRWCLNTSMETTKKLLNCMKYLLCLKQNANNMLINQGQSDNVICYYV